MRRKASQAGGSRYAKAWKQEAHSYFTEVRTREGEVVRERLGGSQSLGVGGGGLGARPGSMLSSASSREPACEGD